MTARLFLLRVFRSWNPNTPDDLLLQDLHAFPRWVMTLVLLSKGVQGFDELLQASTLGRRLEEKGGLIYNAGPWTCVWCQLGSQTDKQAVKCRLRRRERKEKNSENEGKGTSKKPTLLLHRLDKGWKSVFTTLIAELLAATIVNCVHGEIFSTCPPASHSH